MKMAFWGRLNIAIATIFAFGGCASENAPENPSTPKQENTEIPMECYEACKAMRPLSLNIFASLQRQAVESKNARNFVYSPYAVDHMLCIASHAADDATRQNILVARNMHGEDRANESWGRCLMTLGESMPYCILDSWSELSTVSHIWSGKNLSTQSEFVDSLGRVENVDITLTELSDNLLYQWFGDNVPSAVPSSAMGKCVYDRDASMSISSILHFADTWLAATDGYSNKNAVFHNYDGSEKDVEMFTMRTEYSVVGRCEEYTFAQINIGQSNEMYMYLYQPNEGHTIDEVIELLQDPLWMDHCDPYPYKCQLIFTMPRVELSFAGSIDQALSDCGVKLLGCNREILSAPVDNAHMTFAAGASFRADANGINCAEPKFVYKNRYSHDVIEEMTIDRPFMFVVKAAPLGAIYYMGAVNNL